MDITGNESSKERTFLGANTLENESSRAISLRGAKVPGSEMARVLLADSANREQKGCESFRYQFFLQQLKIYATCKWFWQIKYCIIFL